MEVCPHCDSRDVRLAPSLLGHLFRRLRDSHRRYCASCGRKWWTHAVGGPSLLFELGLIAALGLAAAAAGLSIRRGLSPQGPPAEEPEVVSRRAARVRAAAGASSDLQDLTGRSEEEAALLGGLKAAGGGPGRRPSDAGGESAEDAARSMASIERGLLPGGAALDAQRLIELYKQGRLKIPEAVKNDLDTLDKKSLWDKYGSYFPSQDSAKAAYNEYQRTRPAAGAPPPQNSTK